MKQPTKERILEAAKTGPKAKKAIEKLFPELFERCVQRGDIYKWGSSSNGESGMIMDHPSKSCFMLVNSVGRVYLKRISYSATKTELNRMLQEHKSDALYTHYTDEISGPYRMSSWTTKWKG